MEQEAKRILKGLEDDAPLVPERLREWWSTYLWKQHQRYLSTLSLLGGEDRAAKVLEIGSAPGQLTVVLKGLGFDVQGVDIDPARMGGICEKYGLTVHRADVEREPLPLPDASFGIVLFTEILEHLRLNPLFALREVHRVLEPGGRMILSTPNITILDRLRFLAGRGYQGDPVAQFEKLATLGHMGHVRLYSCDEVRRLLEHTGFRVLRQTWKREGPPGKKAGLIRSVYPVKRHVAPCLYVVAGKA